MKTSTPSTRKTKPRARNQEADIEIQRNGKIVRIIRKRPSEVEAELAPEIRDIPGVPASSMTNQVVIHKAGRGLQHAI